MHRRNATLLGIALLALLALVLWAPWGRPGGGGPGADGAPQPAPGTQQADRPVDDPTAAAAAGIADATLQRTDAAPAEAAPRWRVRGQLRLDPAVPIAGPTGAGEIQAHRGEPGDQRGLLRGMMSQLARLDPGNRPSPFGLAVDSDPLVTASVSAAGRFEFGVDTPHLRLHLVHDFYGLPEPLPIHLDTSEFEVDLGIIDTYVGALVRARPVADELPASLEAMLIADPDPMGVMRNPEGFFAQAIGGGRRTARRGPDGAFTFRAVWPGPKNQVSLSHDVWYGRSDSFPLLAGELRELQLELRRGGNLRVTVLDPSRSPIADARVRATPTDVSGDMSRAWLGRSGRTDPGGSAELIGLRPGPYRVVCQSHGLLAASVETTVGSDTRELEIQLEAGATIRGRVVDATGAPVADAGVMTVPILEVPVLGDITSSLGEDLMGRGAADSPTRSDAEGWFELAGLEAGRFHVAVHHEDYLPGMALGVSTGDQTRVVLHRGGGLRGVVVGEDTDAPLAEFAVETLTSMFFMDRPAQRIDVAASEDGSFEMARVPPGTVRLRVTAPGRGTFETRATVETDQVTDLGRIALSLPATIAGWVQDEDGAPIEGAQITRRARGIMENPVMAAFFGDLRTHSAEDGSFRLTNVTPGKLSLSARADGFASGASDRFEVVAGQSLEGIVITLGHGGTLVGTLRVPPGADPTSWDILPNRMPSGAVAMTRPDAEGRFRIENLDPGRYDVQAMQGGLFQQLDDQAKNDWVPGQQLDLGAMFAAINDMVVHARCTIRAGEETAIELDATDTATDGPPLRIQVLLGGERLDTGYVEIIHVGTDRNWFAFLQDGELLQRGVPSGSLQVQVRGGMTMTPIGIQQTVAYESGQTEPIVLTLPAGSIRGEVRDARSGEPLGAALVRVFDEARASGEDTSEFGFALTDDDGRFTFYGLPAGSYTVVADNRMGRSGDRDTASRARGVVVEGSAARDIVLRTEPGAGLDIYVEDELGSPLAGAVVVSLDARGTPLSAVPVAFTRANGRAHLSGLSGGAVRVVARGPGRAPAFSQLLEVAPGQHREVRLRLRQGTNVTLTPTDGEGRVLRGATVSARFGDAWIPTSILVLGRTDNGLELGPLTPGAWEFVVSHPATGPFTATRTIPAGASATLVVAPQ